MLAISSCGSSSSSTTLHACRPQLSGRIKDPYTNVWWMSRVPRPKADNRKVLIPYSPSMKKLLKRKSYNAGRRPSEHHIGKTSFLTDNGGAIPANVFEFSNTVSTDSYRAYCKANGLKHHPERMD